MQQNSTRSNELHQFSKEYLPRNLLIFAKIFNGEKPDAFFLCWSTTQGCPPLSPLSYACTQSPS